MPGPVEPLRAGRPALALCCYGMGLVRQFAALKNEGVSVITTLESAGEIRFTA